MRDIRFKCTEASGVHLLRAFKALTQGVLLTDPTLPDNPIVYVNPGFERMTGYREDELLGQTIEFLFGCETDPAAIALIRERTQSVTPVTVELRNYRKDRSPFWNQLSMAPVRDEVGRLTHFVVLSTDITERRRHEEEVRQSQVEAIGLLAGGVAHEFNNLLTVIAVNAELTLEKLSPESPIFGMISEIKRAGERSVELTRRLQTLSRRQAPPPPGLNLSQVVADTERLLKEHASHSLPDACHHSHWER